ncbi:dihydroorotate dehydrogenase, putative [Theileria equi strain WA]|uniref:Dihydroorotate dehydrogenase (quinone), mitochondrial n=1 Tax=Theileria equi strain WA TaxID=1537102 RepID=L0AU22_THEEQ|nr:dihydroorotate dehydrogenase, putative [Theileria equi strain WA]AFZ79045.1 dihydroorotate dehydrogenase, putative [Theileria equi strain WA]|eukprot:XP_004828711.1 dihydroorotate dehydrogenase, putative [Theileria equi strain WA]
MRRFVDPELSHNISILSAKVGLTPIDYSVDPPILYNNIKHMKIFNPIGMAAGYDKHAEVPLEVLRLGFGFVEVGTILPKPQEGNPKPRMFRLPNNKAIINSYGFNSLGVEKAVENMKRARELQAKDPLTKDSIIGISIGKNKHGEIIEDVTYCIKKIGCYADYIAINISSPNTPNLRDNQRKEPLLKIINASKTALNEIDIEAAANNLPYTNTTKERPLLFIKISPDVSAVQLKDIADVAMQCSVDGLILTNTTVARPESVSDEVTSIGNPGGGLSGKPLLEKSRRIIHEMYSLTNGKIPIIACGGISTPEDALDMIEAGASLCQIYTAMIYEGPKLPSNMKKNLAYLLSKRGYTNISQAIGAAHVSKKKV